MYIGEVLEVSPPRLGVADTRRATQRMTDMNGLTV
jgi:hypothetical protein